MSEDELQKYYEQGLMDGYNFAQRKVFEVFGYEYKDEEPEEKKEFLNKPKRKVK